MNVWDALAAAIAVAWGTATATVTPPLLISIVALLFSIGSFWWLNARPGRAIVSVPMSYGASQGQDSGGTYKVIIQLPLVFLNDRPSAAIVQNLRLIVRRPAGTELVLTFTRTLPDLGTTPADAPKPHWARAFVVDGRKSVELLCQFQASSEGFVFREGDNAMRLEACINHADWKQILAFGLRVECATCFKSTAA
jgi:hypothetical protein